MQRKPYWLVVLFSFLVLVPFAGNYFASDDFDLITKVANGGPFGIWSSAPSLFFRPLVSVSMWLNYQLFGWSSIGYNLTNFALHALCAGFAYLIGRRLGGSQTLAAVTAILFAVAPAHAEATFWISCRTDLLGAFFGLGAIALALTALERRSTPTAIGAVAMLALGLGSKESVYGIFLFLWVVAFTTKERKMGIAMASAATVATALAAFLRSKVVTAGLPYAAEINPIKMTAKGAMMLIRPNIPVDPQIVTHRPGLAPAQIAAVLLLGFAAALVIRQLATPGERERKPLLLPFAGFFFTAAPATIFSMPLLSPEGGRFMYLPSAFATICAVFLLARWLKPKTMRTVAMMAAFFAAAFTALNGILYRRAAEQCLTTIQYMQGTQPPASKVEMYLPDNIGGRYVWRNGFPEAVQSLAPAWKSVEIVPIGGKPVGSSPQ